VKVRSDISLLVFYRTGVGRDTQKIGLKIERSRTLRTSNCQQEVQLHFPRENICYLCADFVT
jgi:hypothetical protein